MVDHLRQHASRGRRLALPAMLLLVLVGFGLRLHQLDAYSFWTDEGLTPERAGYPFNQILRNEILIQDYVTKDTHPPLYYLFIHGTRGLLGESDFAYRYPSVVAGVLLIPLLYQFGRRLNTTGMGLLIALLAATNPLQIYYAQEARMYTLLVLLAAAASYVLWRALSQPDLTRPQLVRYLVLYGLLAGLAFYTHYTAVFLIGFQALFWAWLLWRRGLRRLIIGAAVVGALAAIPLIPYTVPRLFTGAEANYNYVPPLTMFQDVVHFFNLGVTTDFAEPGIKLLDAVALALALLGLRAARTWLKRGFLLSYLLAVVLGLMAGSLVKPMYQGVRHIMLGSPAFLLLIGFGLWWLLTESRLKSGERRRWAAVVGWAMLAAVLAGSAVSLANLYTNPAYVKDDFRAIVRYIEQRAGHNDIVVYNNAVLLPLHEHYRLRADIPATALPVYPQMATGAEPELAALEAYDRVWFVTDPPADKRDEGKLIEGWLNGNRQQVVNQLFPARTTEARVIAYARDSVSEARTGDIEPLDVHWSGWPALSGVAVSPNGVADLPSLWATLVWTGERPPDDAALIFSLRDSEGAEWFADQQPLLPRLDTRWHNAQPNAIDYSLALPAGLPPGSYQLAVSAADGGESTNLTSVEIGPTSAWPVEPESLYARSADTPVAGPPALSFANGLALQELLPWDESVRPGHVLPLTLLWQAGDDDIDARTLRYRLEVFGPGGALLRSQEDRPGAPWLETIPAGSIIREVTGLYIHPDTQPGRYYLRWTLLDGDEVVRGRPAWQPWDRDSNRSGAFMVEPWPLETELPEGLTPNGARFGPAIELAGYEFGQVVPGDSLPLTLAWRALSAPAGDYLVYVHLVSEETGAIVSQFDTIPADGIRPTSGWRQGEVIVDGHLLPLPADLPAGRYLVNVGLYNPDDGVRLPVTVDGEIQPNDQLTLAAHEVAP